MVSFLSDSIRKYSDIPGEEINRLEKSLKPVHLKRGEQFFGPSDRERRFGFVEKGIFRFYYIDEQGRDATRAFIAEGGFLVSREAALKGGRSPFYIEALEDSLVLASPSLPDNIFNSTSSCWNHFLLAMMHERMDVKDRRIEGFILGNAESRYLDFVDEYPRIHSRVPHHYIASYLGVTPVTLSRIRRKIIRDRRVGNI